jgi:hypothetical protein
MNRNIKSQGYRYFLTILVTITLLLNLEPNQLIAQSIDSLKQENSLNYKANPYNSSRTKWLKSNGFKTEEYNWNNPNINLILDKALKKKTGARIWGAAALSKAVIFRKDGGFLLTLAGVSGLIALSKNGKAKQAIKTAEVLRSKFILSDTIPKYLVPLTLTSTKTELANSLQNSDLRWLRRNSFEPNNYHRDNEEINLYLNKSLKQKGTQQATNLMGITQTVLGLAQYYVSLRSNQSESKSRNMFIVSGGFFMTSIILNGASIRNLRIAKRLKVRN